MSYIANLYAERIGGNKFGKETEIFKFEKIKMEKGQADIDNPNINLIDIGVGESDEIADIGIIEKLFESSKKWENRGYADNGIIEFQEAASRYLENVYKVKGVKPKEEILHVIGSKSALSLIPQAFINPGDICLMTVPGYPIMGTKTRWLGGEVYNMPLLEENNFLPDLDSIPREVKEKAKLLYINYPNNPTGAVATYKFFEKVVQFAKENHIIVVHDAAYGALVYNNVKPLSFLSVPGAKEVGIEVHSLSKAFNMTGWRLGFIAGCKEIVDAIKTVKDNNDSGQFRAIQYAGIYALNHPKITENICIKYKRRHKKLVNVFKECGFNVKEPKATFYEYIKIPKGTGSGIIFNSAEEFSTFLIKNAKISIVPWDDAGHYFRASVTFVAENIEKEDEVIQEIKSRLLKLNLIF